MPTKMLSFKFKKNLHKNNIKKGVDRIKNDRFSHRLPHESRWKNSKKKQQSRQISRGPTTNRHKTPSD